MTDKDIYRAAVRAYMLDSYAENRERAWQIALRVEKRIGGGSARAIERAVRRQLSTEGAQRPQADRV